MGEFKEFFKLKKSLTLKKSLAIIYINVLMVIKDVLIHVMNYYMSKLSFYLTLPNGYGQNAFGVQVNFIHREKKERIGK